jgi:drug/metabolite transporter (DMT)-like permease
MEDAGQKKALLFALVAVFFWSTVATAFKIALREINFIQLIFIASGISVVILFFLLVVQGKLSLLRQITPKDLAWSVLLGLLNPAAYYLILFKAYSLLPAQLAQPLNMVWPITLALLSVPLLGQKIRWQSFAALFVSFIGVVFISSQGGISGFEKTSFKGVFLAVGSSLIWALYWIFNVRDKRDEVVKLFFSFLAGFIFLLVIVSIFSGFTIKTGPSLWAAVYTGFFEAGITYVFWMKAMQLSTNNAKTGNLVFIAPFVSLVFIRLILREPIFITTFAGLILIVTGILLQQAADRKAK